MNDGQAPRPPRPIILSAPSGAGKSSLARALIAARENAALSVSHTTRAARPGEIDGSDYHFVDERRFRAMIDEGAFLEYARVFGNYYGTSRAEVRGKLDAGCDVVLEIDWQGARRVREQLPRALSVFILPPSLGDLRRRLTERGQDSDAIIDRRMRDAVDEMRHYDEYDRVIVNREFDHALGELQDIADGGPGGLDPASIDIEEFIPAEKNAILEG